MKLENANLLIQTSPNHKGQEDNIEFLGIICYIYGHLSSKKGNDAGETACPHNKNTFQFPSQTMQ